MAPSDTSAGNQKPRIATTHLAGPRDETEGSAILWKGPNWPSYGPVGASGPHL